MKRICFFATYFEGDAIPYHVHTWLQELKKYFPDIVLLVSNAHLQEKELAFLKEHNITLQTEKNEGYDFGLWYKALQKHDIEQYDVVAFINDSSVLFASLAPFVKWAETQEADLLGMTASMAVSHHIQSYFLWCKKPVIPVVKNYFEQQGIRKELQDVIATYEIGLSKEVLSKGFRIAAFVSNHGYAGEFAPYYHLVDSHLEQGIPLIKKKILFRSYRKDELLTLARMNFDINTGHYYKHLQQREDLIIDLDQLKKSAEKGMSGMDAFQYNVKRILIRILRPVYKIMKGRG
jgi:lipopolysaccharide biosynthesis protein